MCVVYVHILHNWIILEVAMELATIALDVVHYTAAFSGMPWCRLLPLGDWAAGFQWEVPWGPKWILKWIVCEGKSWKIP